MNTAVELLERVLWKIDSEWLADYDEKLCNDIKEYIAAQTEENIHKCSVCGTNENVSWAGEYHGYLCESWNCFML